MKPRGSFTFAKIPATFTLAQDRCSSADFPTGASAASFPPNWSDVEALSSLRSIRREVQSHRVDVELGFWERNRVAIAGEVVQVYPLVDTCEVCGGGVKVRSASDPAVHADCE